MLNRTTHYPFCIYAGIHLFKELVSVLVQNLGFEKHSFEVLLEGEEESSAKADSGGSVCRQQQSTKSSTFSYWLRDASRWNSSGRKQSSPIVLFHGIGTGISSYGVLLKALTSAYPQSSIIVVELPLVAMERPWSKNWASTSTAGGDTLCKPVMQMLRKHNFLPEEGSGAQVSSNKYPVLMGHSFGCFACRWLLNYEPLANVVGGCVLLDPMVFLLPFPDISKRLQAPCHTFYQFLVRRLIMRETSVAYALNRKSKWPKCCLWEEDLRKLKLVNKKFKFDIALSRHDCFFDTNLVASYLDQVKTSLADESEPDNASSSWLKHQTYDCTHGEMIFRPDLLAHTVKMVHNVIN